MSELTDAIEAARQSLILQRGAYCARMSAALVTLEHVVCALEDDESPSVVQLLVRSAAALEEDATGDRRACYPVLEAVERWLAPSEPTDTD